MKILMTTMGLDIGGAETHILELSKALAKKGYDVTVCSNGGVYVEELEKHGVHHLWAPLNVRGITTMVKSFFILYKWVRKNRPGVIHAHARIPAFLSNIVGTLTRTPMITTAHFNFKTTGGLGFLTRWGQRSIAVSEDLKKYLIDNYDIKEENISVTVNGINTDNFSAGLDTANLDKEFGTDASTKWIVTVSRMDHNACLAAFKLIDAAPKIAKKIPNSRIFVVGKGDAIDELKENAKKVNTSIGHEYVTIVGARTDIYSFCSRADLFVGVSRAALEAMACETPVIFAGNQGYWGLFDKNRLDVCYSTNFTFRGIGETTSDFILEDVDKFLKLDSQAIDNLGKNERAIILNSYSVSKMAGDVENVYKSIAKITSYDFLLCGYYGYQNAGDDALLDAIVKSLHRKIPSASIAVLMREGSITGNEDVAKCVDRFNVISLWKAIKKANVMIFGGGNLIQDITSTKSLLYYLTLLKFAQHHGVKTMLYANGIGPLTTQKNKQRVAKVLNKVDVITLRETKSLKMIKELSITKPLVKVTADEVFTVESPNQRTYLGDLPENYITLSIRKWKTLDKNYVEKLKQFSEYIFGKYSLTTVIIPFHDSDDNGISSLLAKNIAHAKLLHGLSIEQTSEVISNSTFSMGMRLHSLIFSASSAVPTIGISYDPKVNGFLDYIGVTSCVKCDNINVDLLKKFADDIMENRDGIVANLEIKAAEMKKAALENAEIAYELLKK